MSSDADTVQKSAAFQPVKKEIAEVFGYPAHSTLPEARRCRVDFLCPFQRNADGSLRRCSKVSQHFLFEQFGQQNTPFGACSVWHRGRGGKQFRPHIICPIRFTQDRVVFLNAQSVLKDWQSGSRYVVVEEVSLPLGRLDYVLLNYNAEDQRILDFVILEVMALSTTTTGDIIRSLFDILGIAEPASAYRYGINLRQVVSRMVIQLVAKAHAAETWGKSTIWAIQDTLYDYMMRTTQLQLADVQLDSPEEAGYPILFFVYHLMPDAAGKPFRLQLVGVKGGYRQDVERVLKPSSTPTLTEMKGILKKKLDANKYIVLASF